VLKKIGQADPDARGSLALALQALVARLTDGQALKAVDAPARADGPDD